MVRSRAASIGEATVETFQALRGEGVHMEAQASGAMRRCKRLKRCMTCIAKRQASTMNPPAWTLATASALLPKDNRGTQPSQHSTMMQVVGCRSSLLRARQWRQKHISGAHPSQH